MCICAVDNVAILCSFQQEMKTLGVAIHGWKHAHTIILLARWKMTILLTASLKDDN